MSQPVIAARRDGLAQRIKALVTASYLSEKLGYELKLFWPDDFQDSQFHSIVSVDQMFEPDFVRQHVISFEELRAMRVKQRISSAAKTATSLEDLLDEYGLICDAPINSLQFEVDKARLFEIFWNLPLKGRYRDLLAKANGIPLGPNVVGIHLRGGDVIYERFRHHHRFQEKVMPIGLGKAVAMQAIKDGKVPLVFAQDAEVARLMGQIDGVILAESYTKFDDVSEDERAFFEMSLITRCQQIVSGHTGFTELAEMLTNCEIVNFREHYKSDAISDYVARDLTECGSEYNDLHKAFLWYNVAYYLDPRRACAADPNPILSALEQAASLDPANGLYPFMSIVQHLALDRPDAADALLRQHLKVEFAGEVDFDYLLSNVPLFRSATAKRLDGVVIMDRFFIGLHKPFADHPFLTLYQAILHKIRGHQDEALRLVKSADFSAYDWHPFVKYLPAIELGIEGPLQ